MQRLRQFAQEFDVIGDVRGAGLMIGMEFVKDRAQQGAGQGIRDPARGARLREWPAAARVRRQRHCGIIPPLMIEAPLLDEGLDILHRSFKEVLAE